MSKKVKNKSKELPKEMTRLELLDDTACCKLLSISIRTLYKYRQNGLIRGFKIGGRTYYFKHIIWQTFLQLQEAGKIRTIPETN